MNPTLSNFILNIVGIGIGGLIAIIGAFSKCFKSSRCTNIKTPCFSCDREVLEEVDKDSDTSTTGRLPSFPTIRK